MATSPLNQIPTNAVDAAGLSITTLIKSATDPRPGHIYDTVNLAAAVPVHFHHATSQSLGGDSFLMLNNQRWTSATQSTTNPGQYTAHTLDSNPNWVLVNAATGVTTAINSGYDIPMTTANTNRTLTAAVSRGTDMLWTLNSVSSGTKAVVQHWHIDPVINTVKLLGEETIPSIVIGADTVVFSSGLQLNSTTAPYMHAYGIGSVTNQVYMARKEWSHVGHTIATGGPNPTISEWEYYNGKGFTSDVTALKPVQTASGPLISHGPLSFGHYAMNRAQRAMRNNPVGYRFVSTVQASGSSRSGQIYSSLGGRPWVPIGSPVALGTSGTTYMGGTLQLQGHVGPNPATVTGASAIPYVYTVGGTNSLVVSWGLLQVPLLS